MTSNVQSPLENLHDVIVPTSISWWPLSPAAFALIALCLAVISTVCYVFYRRVQYNKAKKQALSESKQLLTVTLENTQQLHILLKRLVKHYYSTEAANFSGKKWCEQLSNISKIELQENELSLLYQDVNQDTDNQQLAQLHVKLVQAVSRFKVKGAI